VGFPPVEALVFALIFNTTPVAFGGLGIPVNVLAAVQDLAPDSGRGLCDPGCRVGPCAGGIGYAARAGLAALARSFGDRDLVGIAEADCGGTAQRRLAGTG
jgi:hypothetical protein